MRVFVVTFLGVVAAWLAAFSLSLYYVEKLPGAGVLAVVGRAPQQTDALQPDVPPEMVSDAPCAPARNDGAAPELYAYLPNVPDWAGFSLRQSCGMIDVLLPEWYAILDLNAGIVPLSPQAGDREALLAQVPKGADRTQILPVLTLSFGDLRAASANNLSSPQIRANLAEAAEKIVTDNNFSGLCLATTEMLEEDLAGFKALFLEIATGLAAHGQQVCLIAAADGPVWRDAQIVAAADTVIFLAFKTPESGSLPAPLAAQAWFERIISEAVAQIGPDKLVVAMGSLAQDWTVGSQVSERIGFAEAMRRAARHQGQISLSPDALNTTILWGDGAGSQHEIWVLDAVSLRNQRTVLDRFPIGGMALWALGFEDPKSWAALTKAPSEQLERLSLNDYVGYEGQGPFMRVLHPAETGHRSLTQDTETGLIQGQTYSVIPQPFSIERFGAGADDMVVLTFDDGPDAAITPAILDALKAQDVPAAFFLIGSNILKSPEVVRRMVSDGHEIGSHTFFHPDIERISALRERLELNTLQRLVVSVTGHSTALFRTPYGRGLGPLTTTEALPFVALDQRGYVVVGANVVPPDWQDVKPSEIVSAALAQLRPSGGNVIVLHDGGGDRSATIAALPTLIKTLRAKGYRFVSLGSLLGVPRDAVMPTETGARVALDAYSFRVVGAMGSALRGVFWVAITLGGLRATLILILAILRRHRPLSDEPYTPAVTVIIPAFNEEAVIVKSIATVLASDYPDLRLIVVDDGSGDHTCANVEAAYADDPRVEILHEANQGKWMALDTAYARIKTDIVVTIDADTIILPDAIRKLTRAFRDPRVGAVAGKVQIGNQRNLLTKFQALEYITAQNIDRRAAEVFNGILVVPGAIGAWRAAAVRKTGLYSNETMAEDADLTVSVLRAGYRVVYEEDAISITEAPETVRNFMKQRLRWTFGMMQTGWKHRRAAREGRAVGLISIPDLWLFGVALALLAPIADLVFLGVIVDAVINLILGQPLFATPTSTLILTGYLLLPVIEVLTALAAFGFERRMPTLVLLIPIQRLFYRQLLYITVYRAVWRALTGKLAEWGKLVRSGTVQVPSP